MPIRLRRLEMRSSHARSGKQRKNYVPLIQPMRIEIHSCIFVSWRSWTSRRCGEQRVRINAGEFELSFSRTGFWLVPIARFPNPQNSSLFNVLVGMMATKTAVF